MTRAQAGAMAAPVQLVQSLNDPKKYRFLTLLNQMRVLLVSDTSLGEEQDALGKGWKGVGSGRGDLRHLHGRLRTRAEIAHGSRRFRQ